MKIKELIEKLSNLDPELEVVASDGFGDPTVRVTVLVDKAYCIFGNRPTPEKMCYIMGSDRVG